MIEGLLSAAQAILTSPAALGLGLAATLLGIVLGALPGISSTMALAVLLPFSFAMPPTHAIVFLMGIFYGSVYGGSLSAILLNVPGTPGSMVTQLDGYPMAQQGRAGEALTLALYASTFGGIFGFVCLITLAPVLASAALAFQSAEFTAMMVFGLAMLAYASPGSTFLGLLGGVIGLLIGCIGLDSVTNIDRLSFGHHNLQAGINLIPVVVGLFGLAEVLSLLGQRGAHPIGIGKVGRLLPPWSAVRDTLGTATRSSAIGVVVGIIPAAGSALAVAIAYAQEKRLYERRETFGNGNPRGVVSAEAGNNACVGGALVPMMTLGIPGDTMTAVLVGALLVHGLKPGPELFEKHPDFVAAVYLALALAIVFTAILAIPGMRIFARVVSMPPRILHISIVLLCVVGSYAVQNSAFDILVMIVAGCAGYVMNRLGMPTAPVVFGLVLGPLLEENVRRTLIVHGSWSVFFERPIAAALLAVSVATVIYPALAAWRRRAIALRRSTP